jgi:phosphoglucosamine mutase
VPEIDNLGLVTTPAAAVWARQSDCPHLAVITSSHTGGPQWLGLKLYRDAGIPLPFVEEEALRRVCTVENVASSAYSEGTPQIRWVRNEVIESYRLAISPYLIGLNGTTVHVLSQWVPFLREIGINNVMGDGFADPKGASMTASAGLHFYLDGDADQLVALSGGELFSAQMTLHAWITQSAAPCVVSADCHPDIIAVVKNAGQRVFVTPVGDQFVVEEMIRQDAAYGGEPNGHLIDASLSWSPDALRVASFISTSPNSISSNSVLDLKHERYRIAQGVWTNGLGERGFKLVEPLGVWTHDMNGTRVMVRESIYEDSVIVDVFGRLEYGDLAIQLGAAFNEAEARIA